MYVICTNEVGFEDQLTQDSVYQVEELGLNSYKIANDKEEINWYGTCHFSIVKEVAL